ncbi:hypothetical protein ABIB81_008198 [Bradyrhizobium sp. I1.7.5]
MDGARARGRVGPDFPPRLAMDASQQDVSIAGLSRRAQAALSRAFGPPTRENVQSLTQRDLIMLVGVGRRTLNEIVSWAAASGLRFHTGSEAHAELPKIIAVGRGAQSPQFGCEVRRRKGRLVGQPCPKSWTPVKKNGSSKPSPGMKTVKDTNAAPGQAMKAADCFRNISSLLFREGTPISLRRGNGGCDKVNLGHSTFVRAPDESTGGEYSPAPSLEPVRRGGPGVSAPLQPPKAPPAVLVDLDLKSFRHPRHFTFASSVAGRAGRASAATAAGARAVPRAVRVVLANPAEIVTADARRGRGTGRRRLTLARHQATPRKGSASCMSKRFVALAAMKSCSADEISASVSAARWASASATSEVAFRDHPSTGLKDTIRTG